MEIDHKDRNKTSGLLFVGCLFVGMAVGFWFHQLPIGLFGGMGVGFLASAAYRARRE